jgi:hypothetical protein
MLKNLFLTFFACIAWSIGSKAQVYDSNEYDSLVIDFDTAQISDFLTDSSGLWQIGTSNKTFFSSGGFTERSMMTDTVNTYPVNADAWFVVTFPGTFHFNVIVDFTHKFQTDSGKDGGIVEFSSDSGQTWENVLGDCNMDSFMYMPGVHTENLYSTSDTLENGERAFTGESNGWIHSRVQFFYAIPVKGTAACDMYNVMMVRFRFVSDSVAESLDGWIIGGITVEQDEWASVKDVNKKQNLKVYPNPSADGQFYFPEIANKGNYKMEILNSFGQKVYNDNYQRSIDLSKYAKGLYFYKVVGENEQYSGQLISQ